MRSMAIDRRQFLLGAAALPLAEQSRRGRFAAARAEASGGFGVSVFDRNGEDLWAAPLPARGHGMALSPDARSLVVMARRPGDFGLILSAASGATMTAFEPAPGLRFNGHAVFSADGGRIFATATRAEDDSGWIAVHDRREGWQAVDAWPTRGCDPHELIWFQGALCVANGGLPEGRTPLDPAEVETSLVLMHAGDGDILAQIRPPEEAASISLRHMAVAADRVFVGGQDQAGESGPLPLLVEFDGRSLRYLAPLSLAGYCGSVASSDDLVCVTGPKAGRACVVAAESGRLLSSSAMDDVCGVAADPAGGFVLTGGHGDIGRTRDRRRERSAQARWDNHLLALPAA
jgi:hypothetical protein